VLLGSNETAKEKLQDQIELRLAELGVDHENHVVFLGSRNSADDLIPGAPVVGVYFEGLSTGSELAFLSHLISIACVVVPVVNDLGKYHNSVPEILYPINGIEFDDNLDRVTNTCLEALNLLRRSRRLFISYRRQESRTAAIQLYERLDRSGFDVFLDTVSMRPGDPFQEVLWHRLSDTDVVVLLDTPGFLDSRWTEEELAKASAMTIGLLQLVWPNHAPAARSDLCSRFYLDSKRDFSKYDVSELDNPLTDKTLDQIVVAVESLRARSFAARYDNLVKELKNAAVETGCSVSVQADRHVLVSKVAGKSIATIPAVGVPEAINYQEIHQIYTERADPEIVETVLLYDHRNIRETWNQHLCWLDRHLPVGSVRITEVTQWLQRL
jgi:hypothetical protein